MQSLADLLDRYFETPQLFDLDKGLAQQLVEYTTEITSLFLSTNDARTKLVCAGALVRIDQSFAEAVLPVLMAGLEGGDATRLAFCALCLGVLGPTSLPAMPLLIRLLSHDDDNVVYESAKTLGKIGSASTPHLIEALDSVTSCVGNAAAVALGEMGAAAKDALPSLHKCLDLDGSYWTKGLRLMAADAIWKISNDNTHALAIASELLDDEDFVLCLRACQVLAELGSASRPYAEKLRELMKHRVQCVRREAAKALLRCWFE